MDEFLSLDQSDSWTGYVIPVSKPITLETLKEAMEKFKSCDMDAQIYVAPYFDMESNLSYWEKMAKKHTLPFDVKTQMIDALRQEGKPQIYGSAVNHNGVCAGYKIFLYFMENNNEVKGKYERARHFLSWGEILDPTVPNAITQWIISLNDKKRFSFDEIAKEIEDKIRVRDE
jgi:hypothetical protein